LQTDLFESWEGHRVDMQDTKMETFKLKQDELPSDRERVYQEILNNGSITLKEICDKWGCPPNSISGRITELHKEGFIIGEGKRYFPNYKGKMYPHTIWRAIR
jgi:DNA-binding Lrp family transcriptional regulator